MAFRKGVIMKKETKRNRRGISILCLLCMAVCLTGCGAENKADMATSYESAQANSYDWGDGADLYAEDVEMEEAATEETAEYDSGTKNTLGTESLENTAAEGRKLIRRVNLSVETQNFSELTQNIEKKVEELGGYVESSSVYGGSIQYDSLQNANYTIRVPADKLDVFVSAVAKTSNITNKSETATDVTLQYVDTKSRKEALTVEQERLMDLLEKADTIETIVALESRLTEVRYEIQNLESQLRTYDNQVDYATVSISISEVEIYSPDVTEPVSDLERMTNGFVNSVKRVIRNVKEFLIGLVIVLPYLIVWAVVIVVCVWIIKVCIRRNKKKKEKKMLQKSGQKADQVIVQDTAQTDGQEDGQEEK